MLTSTETVAKRLREIRRHIADARRSVNKTAVMTDAGAPPRPSSDDTAPQGTNAAALAAILIKVLSSSVLRGQGSALGEDLVSSAVLAIEGMEDCRGAAQNVRDNLAAEAQTQPVEPDSVALAAKAVQYEDEDLYSRHSASPFRGDAPVPDEDEEDNGHPACRDADDVPIDYADIPQAAFDEMEASDAEEMQRERQVLEWRRQAWEEHHAGDTPHTPMPKELQRPVLPEQDPTIAEATAAAAMAAVWMAPATDKAAGDGGARAAAPDAAASGAAAESGGLPSSALVGLASQSRWACPWPSKAGVDEAGEPATFTAFNLQVVYVAGKTGFAEDKDFSPRVGSVIAGRFAVTRRLGSAAFSQAVAALDLSSGMEVCLKIVKNNKEFVDQSLDEIKLLEYINRRAAHVLRRARHASDDPTDPDPSAADVEAAGRVLRLLDFFYFKEHLFIVTELLKDNLYEFQKFVHLRELPPFFTAPRVALVARQILSGLSFIHGVGVLHCDLKPENLLLSSYGRCRVKVIDFGSSCFITDHLTSYIQSRSYRAPEVMLGNAYGPKIDIWSLGCILFELLTGRVLFVNDEVPTILARIQSVLGPIPRHLVDSGRDAEQYFTASYQVFEAPAEEGGDVS